MIWKFTACLRGHSVWPDRNPLSMAFRNRGASPCCSFVYPFVHASNISLSKTILSFRVIVYGLLAGQRGGGGSATLILLAKKNVTCSALSAITSHCSLQETEVTLEENQIQHQWMCQAWGTFCTSHMPEMLSNYTVLSLVSMVKKVFFLKRGS